jgi:hypothetical protein
MLPLAGKWSSHDTSQKLTFFTRLSDCPLDSLVERLGTGNVLIETCISCESGGEINSQSRKNTFEEIIKLQVLLASCTSG